MVFFVERSPSGVEKDGKLCKAPHNHKVRGRARREARVPVVETVHEMLLLRDWVQGVRAVGVVLWLNYLFDSPLEYLFALAFLREIRPGFRKEETRNSVPLTDKGQECHRLAISEDKLLVITKVRALLASGSDQRAPYSNIKLHKQPSNTK